VKRIAAALLALAPLACHPRSDGDRPAPPLEPSTPVVAATAESAAPPSIPFAVIARGDDLRLYALGTMAAVVSGRLLFIIDDAGLHQDLAWHAGWSGVPEAREARDDDKNGYDLLGLAPDALWLQAWAQGTRAGKLHQEIQSLHWTGKAWRPVRVLDIGETLVGVVPIGKGGSAGLVLGDGGTLHWISGDTRSPVVPSAPLPRDDARDEGRDAGAPGAHGPARLRLEPVFWTWADRDDRGLFFPGGSPVSGSPAGQVVLVGFDARRPARSLLVERWPPGGRSAVVEPPEASGSELGVFAALAVEGAEAWIYGTATQPYLAHFDGSTWAREAPPGPGSIASMTASADGAVYLVMKEALYRRSPGGTTWEPVDLPAHGGSLTSVAVVAGKLWVATTGELIGPEAPRELVRLPSAADTRAAREEVLRYPITEVCTSPYVRLRASASIAATSVAEIQELVRRTLPLEGVELVTEACRRATCLGARVPSVAAAVKLRDAMNAREPSAAAEAFCHVPQATKRIPLAP